MNLWMLLAVGILGWSAWQIWWGRASQTWPSTQGKIESVTIRRTRRGNGSRRKVHVKYDYAVNETSFRGSWLRYGYFGTLFDDDADDVANSYPPDSPVTVHHHPRRPSMSVLEPGFDRANVALNLNYFGVGRTRAVAAGACVVGLPMRRSELTRVAARSMMPANRGGRGVDGANWLARCSAAMRASSSRRRVSVYRDSRRVRPGTMSLPLQAVASVFVQRRLDWTLLPS
jgi:hypothetical protein